MFKVWVVAGVWVGFGPKSFKQARVHFQLIILWVGLAEIWKMVENGCSSSTKINQKNGYNGRFLEFRREHLF